VQNNIRPDDTGQRPPASGQGGEERQKVRFVGQGGECGDNPEPGPRGEPASDAFAQDARKHRIGWRCGTHPAAHVAFLLFWIGI